MDPIRVIYHHEPEGWWAESPDEVLKLTEEGTPCALECEEGEVELEHFVPAGESKRVAA
jgi:hypothetical protein